ncbi:MarR family transcriptional regulator [Methylonatrum kenyense]|uniref:MarR family winged helix-turn-helix transcriptional regulator n=1 Tax=Methylonatrum kenyense TaxID=455253 RepID=UPI0020C12CFC|nr:MarR family transcriptional regulator [Methylonatrum kenyense]MCK8517160.1 MarR family transcriptional regulator [Methylonatrum kenyense]
MNNQTTPQFRNLLLEEQLCFALCRASRAITRTFARRLEPTGLNHSQYLVMLALWEENGLSASRLAARVNLDPSSLTPILKRLESMSLIRRVRPKDNQRTVLVRLTAAGQELQPCTADIQRAVADATGLTGQDLAALRATLHRLADTLQKEEEHRSDVA